MSRLNLLVAVAFVILASATLASGQSVLVNGVPVTANVGPFQFQNFTFLITSPIQNIKLEIITGSGCVFAFAQFNEYPTFTSNVWKDISTSPRKEWSVPTSQLTQPTKVFISVYGFQSDMTSTFTISVTILDATITPGQIVSGDLATHESNLFRFVVPPNVFNMRVAAVASSGDPDQYIGFGFIPPLAVQNSTYSNTSTGVLSCIDVSMPPAGEYFYVLYSYAGPFSFRTQLLFNVDNNGCAIKNPPSPPSAGGSRGRKNHY